MSGESAQSLVLVAREAMGNDQLLEGVEAIYRALAATVASRGPVCHQCSRCCHFDTYGHSLFVSTAEVALFFRRTKLSRIAGPIGGGCPFLRRNPARCGARAARPLGCRLFYCDESAKGWQQDLYIVLHRQMQHLHGRGEVPYFYGEWLSVLRASTISDAP